MTRMAGICVSITMGLFAVGCTTGDSMGDNNTLGRVCTATFTASGTFMPGAAAPTGWSECWPVGMWTFSMTQTASDCSTAPAILPSYQMRGDQITDMNGDPNYQMAYVTDPTTNNIAKVTKGGGTGQCEGELDLYSADGNGVFYWKPYTNADNTITGDGEYTLYTNDQWTGLQGG